MVILNIKVEDSSPLANIKRELARIKREIMGAIAIEFIKTHVMPHFGPANRARFKHDKRNDIYLLRIKIKKGQGQGKYVDDILSGVSKRQVQSTLKFTKTQDRAVVRAQVPTYFARPFVGTVTRQVRQKNGTYQTKTTTIRKQPNKVRELTTVDDRTRNELAEFGARFGQRLWKQSPKRTKTIKG